jgi:long-chain fatty acid transport protein
MMTKVRTIIFVMCFTLLATQLFAGGFALTGVGSRATSMAGAFRGLSDDPSAMFWNPAGLGFMNENSFSLGGTFILPSAAWDPSGTDVTTNPGYSDTEYEAEQSLRMFPTAFVTMTKESRLKYGLGVYVPYGLGTTWDAYQLPSASPMGPLVYTDGFPDDEMMSSVAVLDVHPTVAYQILPNLSAGAGFSLMFGSIDITQLKFNPALGATYMYAPITSDLSGSGIGYGANMGIMFKPTQCMSIGVSGKLPSEIAMEGDAEVYLWTPASIDSLGNPVPPAKMGGKSDIDATLKLPAEIGIGIASTRIPNLTITLDYAYTMWERLDEVVVEMKDPAAVLGTTESVLVFDWENTHRVSFGMEYALACNKFRAGVFFDQSPIPDETQIPTLSDIGNKISTNLGWGREFGAIGIETNVQYVMFPEREIKNADATLNNKPGKYNASSISGNIGLSYRF